MPAARYWRLVAIEAHGGADMEMSALHLYDAAGRADAAASLSSTIAPTAGTLAALQDDDLVTSCRFAAASLCAGGFAIVWDLGAGNSADICGPRLAGPALETFLASCTLQCSNDGLLWQWVADFARFGWPGAEAYTNAPVAVDDPHFSKVALLLHCDGADGSTLFTDSSRAPKAVTANGNAKISTAQSKFGGASLKSTSTSCLVSVPDSQDFDFGNGDFTIEFWLNPTSVTEWATYIDKRTSGAMYSPFVIQRNSTDQIIRFLASYTGDVWGVSISVAHPPLNVFTHIAFVRHAGVFKAFIGGVLSGSIDGGVNSLLKNTATLNIAADGANLYGFIGHLDDLRITKGVARYTADFTPPTEPFPGSGMAFLAPLLRAPSSERARIAASAPVPPHSTLSAPRLLTARNVEFAGTGTASATGTIHGSTAIKGTPNAPVRAKVSLLRARDLLLVQQTWSDPATGAYAFHGLDPFEKYTTLAEYPTGDYRAVAADQLTPDIEEARAP